MTRLRRFLEIWDPQTLYIISSGFQVTFQDTYLFYGLLLWVVFIPYINFMLIKSSPVWYVSFAGHMLRHATIYSSSILSQFWYEVLLRVWPFPLLQLAALHLKRRMCSYICFSGLSSQPWFTLSSMKVITKSFIKFIDLPKMLVKRFLSLFNFSW